MGEGQELKAREVPFPLLWEALAAAVCPKLWVWGRSEGVAVLNTQHLQPPRLFCSVSAGGNSPVRDTHPVVSTGVIWRLA